MTSGNPDVLVEIEDLTKYFYQNETLLDRLDPTTSRQIVHAVDGVNLTIKRGEVSGLVGESGCGKSTLARVMLKLIEPTDGTVYFDGENIMEYSEAELKQFRRKAQLIYQDPFSSLNPRHTVKRIVRDPLTVHDIGHSKRDRNQRVTELIRKVDLDEEHLDQHPHQLSGGQRQRVAIARALALDPELIIADEPTSALDASVQARFLNLLQRLQREQDLTMLFISHDLSVIKHITDRVAVMYLGQIVENSMTQRFYENPKHPYSQTLLSSIPVADPAASAGRIRLQGNVPSPIDPPGGCRFHTRCPKQIPPAEWEGSQEGWIQLYRLKQALDDRIEETEDHERSEVDPGSLRDEFEGTLDENLTDTQSELLENVWELLTTNDLTEARDLLDAEFVSPCQETEPSLLETDDDHEVRCLLYEDQISATDQIQLQTQ